MNVELPQSEEIVVRESKTRGLAYNKKFRELLQRIQKEHPNIIQTFQKGFAKAQSFDKETSFTEDGLEFTVIRNDRFGLNGGGGAHSVCCRVTLGDQDFLVKKRTSQSTVFGGYQEFMSTQDAQVIKKEFPFVEIVSAQLGYTDHEGESFYVSQWRNLPTLRDYLRNNKNREEVDEINDKFTQISWFLTQRNAGFYDVSMFNSFYDANSKKIVLFDLLNEYRRKEFPHE